MRSPSSSDASPRTPSAVESAGERNRIQRASSRACGNRWSDTRMLARIDSAREVAGLRDDRRIGGLLGAQVVRSRRRSCAPRRRRTRPASRRTRCRWGGPSGAPAQKSTSARIRVSSAVGSKPLGAALAGAAGAGSTWVGTAGAGSTAAGSTGVRARARGPRWPGQGPRRRSHRPHRSGRHRRRSPRRGGAARSGSSSPAWSPFHTEATCVPIAMARMPITTTRGRRDGRRMVKAVIGCSCARCGRSDQGRDVGVRRPVGRRTPDGLSAARPGTGRTRRTSCRSRSRRRRS